MTMDHSLHAVNLLLLVFYTAALWVVYAASPRLRGMRLLAAAYTVALAGEAIKSVPSIQYAPGVDLALAVSLVLYLVTLRYAFLRILEQRTERVETWALVSVATAVALAVLNETGHMLTRSAVASTVLCAISALNALLLLQRAPVALRVPARCIAAVHLLYALRSLWRVGFIVAAHKTPEMAGVVLPLLSVGGTVMLNVLTPLGVLWMAAMRMQAELEEQSSTDPLTGALNRRAFDRKGRMEMERSRRHRLPMAVVEMDVDHFKHLNDSHGHTTGDRVLVRLAEQVGQQLRTTDVLARFGGDEFMLLLPVTTLEGARELAERLREGVEQMVVEAQAERVQVRASFGVAALAAPEEDAPVDAEAWETLIEQADDALYRAKKKGRNRVE